ncbi:MAG: uncharacterized membrane protein YgdD (TMEM256/DUF423 family) [Cycloclasticus pugetii]|jgi:uncharacterized membrane protein YgdD (TMEM256/DUF423 family)|uniref:Small membrane protein n=1 Tax=Cycloclasticus pugetii TaxID=34068 RepID=A0AB33Z214_9GAMM|nr:MULTISPECIES: DUF423 domain-containing protein [Cycloclasticus]ATI02508.1 DUF423 domain-containing protein [Cycloclasticus sp. PY97N]EPD12971.1 small membrane protein [Cycloclasticus pugetii]MBV1898609.1 DUF423 domain-containing protein [Cycloclasticus sp.]
MKTLPFITLGAFFAFLAVVIGAFGAHAVKGSLSPHYLAVYHTASDYQMWHAIGLILIGVLHQNNPSNLLRIAGWFMLAGMLIFSGSLYILSLTGITILGAITPIGGIALLIAWLLFAYHSFKSK